MSADFALQVLALLARTDHHDAIFWRTDGGYAPITFWVNCSDVFAWGGSDLEDLTPDTLLDLDQAFRDCEAASGSNVYGPELYCARRRGMRPQGAAYPKDWRLWALFDACGPARDVGPGNPHRHPAEAAS